jgi:hypothetical protein
LDCHTLTLEKAVENQRQLSQLVGWLVGSNFNPKNPNPSQFLNVAQ